jgi:hypothetical protein
LAWRDEGWYETVGAGKTRAKISTAEAANFGQIELSMRHVNLVVRIIYRNNNEILFTVDLNHLSGDLHAEIVKELVLVVVEDLESLLDLVGANLRRLASELDHICGLLLVQLLNMALALYHSTKH